jgi:hypothetical protein
VVIDTFDILHSKGRAVKYGGVCARRNYLAHVEKGLRKRRSPEIVPYGM